METLIGIVVGIGLSAACGFRIFVPLLVMNLASLSGLLHLSSGFAWIGSYYATVAFGSATIVEVLGYYLPWLDHVLDIVTTPAAVIAGTVVTASILELVGSIFTALLAIFVPILCLVLVAFLCIFVIRRAGRLLFGRIKMAER